MSIDNRLRSANTGLSILEALQLPTSALLGVDSSAAAALADVGIRTVFDLGTSALFAQASMAATLTGSRVGAVPHDLFQQDLAQPADDDYSTLPIASLRALSNEAATALSAALDVTTIQELAFWPPRVAAHQMVGAAAGTTSTDVEDAAAERLRPEFGEYPTERVYFNRLVMLGMADSPAATPLSDPLSLDAIVDNPVVFGKPAIGGLATYAQSWYAEGITLGHMLHSLALAPGEATRLAVVDWSRRSRAASTEAIDENEQLNNSMDHSRAVSEVQNAVAKEMQSGGSMTSGWAHSESSADNLSLSLGGGVAGIYEGVAGVFGFGGGGSTASQSADTSFGASSTSWSVGSRSVMAEMSQRVNDRTEQHASAVRNRRASAVREVSQSEHEEISTRIVANYNHMHALTIQYYEVVQVYRVLTTLHSFERVLFVPFALLDFTKNNADAVVMRFQSALARAALSPRVRSLILDPEGSIEARSATRVDMPINVAVTAVVSGVTAMARARDAAADATSGVAGGTGGTGDTGGTRGDILTGPPPLALRRTLVRPGPIVEILPGDASLVSLSFEGVAVERVRIEQDGVPASDSTFAVPATTDQLDLATPIPLRRVTSVHIGTDGSAAAGTMFVRAESGGRQRSFGVPIEVTQNTRLQRAAYFAGDSADRRKELLEHLQANRAYYTQAVLGNLDSTSLVMLLSGVSWQGEPLVHQIEPNPIAVAGNYLVLGAPAEDDAPSGLNPSETWAALLRDREITRDRKDQRIVPIPTGGVFAEAVLGRSNSAEKLDITRFWNWQDSPIPIQPPEISPVSAASRAQPETLTPGQLGAPLVSMMSPSAVPDPAGLSAVLGAIASGNMFRDMSGLAGTQAMAGAASAGTLTAATEAGRIASDNFKAATQQATEMAKTAADLWKVWKSSENGKSGSGGSGGPGSGGISGDGARINQGRDLDRRGISSDGSGESSTGGAGLMSGPSLQDTLDEKLPGVTGNRSRELAYSDEATAASPGLMQETAEAWGVPVTPAAGSRAGAKKKTKPRDVILKITLTEGPFDQFAGDVKIHAWEGNPIGKRIWTREFAPTIDGKINSPKIRTAASVVTVNLFVRVGGVDPSLDQPAQTFDDVFVVPVDRQTAELKVEVETKGKAEDVDAPDKQTAIERFAFELQHQGLFTLGGSAVELDPGRYRVVVSYLTGKLKLNPVQ